MPAVSHLNTQGLEKASKDGGRKTRKKKKCLKQHWKRRCNRRRWKRTKTHIRKKEEAEAEMCPWKGAEQLSSSLHHTCPVAADVPLCAQHPVGSLQPHWPTRFLCSRGHVLAVLPLPFIKRYCLISRTRNSQRENISTFHLYLLLPPPMKQIKTEAI